MAYPFSENPSQKAPLPSGKYTDNTCVGVLAIIKNDFRDSANYMKKDKPLLTQIIVLIAIFSLALGAQMIVSTPILIVETLHMSDEL